MSGLKLEGQEAVWGKGLAVQQYHLLENPSRSTYSMEPDSDGKHKRVFLKFKLEFGPLLQHPMQWVREAPNALSQGWGELLKGSSFLVILGSDKECIGQGSF